MNKSKTALTQKREIYFDNAATTAPLFFVCDADAARDNARTIQSEALFPRGSNPSSPHALGIRAERELAAARADFAATLSCRASEIVFTSGGTEANNLAILGFALANKRRGASIFAAPWEHPSVLEPIKFAAEQGLTDAGVFANSSNCAAGQSANRPIAPRLVCLSHVSHETGDICNLTETAARLKKENPETIVFVDGAQGFCKEMLSLANIDMYSFSGHKIHGASGFGGLFIRGGLRLVPLLHGGGQENALRAGTENLRGALKTAHAAKTLAADLKKNHTHAADLKSSLLELTRALPDVFENALTATTSPYILNLSFIGIKGETLVHVLSENGIYASMGAACRSRKKQKSALEVMGFDKSRAESAVRFSFSHLNTLEETETVKKIIIKKVSELRRILKR
ncbi:MAG: aminotransferase class V-fold PLP-dependent enzyme [Defluviitaleaceae bacterium]|nr:aminotransferase class V-fold PLP-dependent enzyme [Defluviitaleaceae bacterium]